VSLDSPWTHAICGRCWDKLYQELRGDPMLLKDADFEKCCFCREWCMSGIYVRNDPTDETMKCRGQHDD